MSNINTAKKEAAKLLEHIQQGKKSLKTNLEKYNKQIEEGYLGEKQGQELFQEEKDNFNSSTRKMAQQLLNTFQEYEQLEIEQLRANQDPITADAVAELQLLGQLDTSSEELQEYAEKYSNNQLALRRIDKIAKEKEIMFALPESKEEKIQNSYKKLQRIAERYEYMHYSPGYSAASTADDMTIGAELEELQSIGSDLADDEKEV